MILVLASSYDDAARSLVKQWSSHGARLLCPDDLCVVGWRHGVGSTSGARAIADGVPVPLEDLRGVLVRLPAVTPFDLPLIHCDERAYVSAEMTAFLLAWLHGLPCPVLNRPTPVCLMGPAMRPEQWVHTAADSGLPVVAVRRTTSGYGPPLHPPASTTVVTVVGDQCVGATSEIAARRALMVARRAGASVLSTYFAGPAEDPVFLGADLWIDLQNHLITDAALALLHGSKAKEQEVST
jgi:hypothetical protein